MAGLASEEGQELFRSIALAAGRYGFNSSIEDGRLDIRAWEVLIASTSGESRVRIAVEGDTIIVENIGFVTLRRFRVPIDRPGDAVTLAYYAWLDRNRSLESRVVKALVRIGRSARPARNCPEIFERVTGHPYREGSCSRLAALIAYGAYKSKALFGVDPEQLTGDSFFPEGVESREESEQLSSFASLVRALGDAYEGLQQALAEGARLFDRYRHIPLIVKAGLALASYMDRLSLSWRVYLAGLNIVRASVRMARRCRGVGLVDAAILGEAAWLRTGDGSVACEGTSPAFHGLALAHYTRIGGRVSVVQLADRRMSRCLSYGEPACAGLSIVVDPGEAALRRAASCSSTGECGVTIVYYGERPIVLAVDSSSPEARGFLVLAGIPERRISMVDVLMPGKIARIARGRPARGISGEALARFSRATRFLVA